MPQDPTLPRLIACGEQLTSESYFPGLALVPPGHLVAAAMSQVDAGATWVKVITDWGPRLLYPIEELRETVDVAHRVGIRVAAHCQWDHVGAVVDTGVDSIEHGTAMTEDGLRAMAARGTAWAPTTNATEAAISRLEGLLERDDLDPAVRSLRQASLTTMRRWRDTCAEMIPRAYELGVTVLASTDREGTVADEVARFVRYGIDPVEAVESATTRSRQFLGAPGLHDGAPADVVTFDADPRVDPSILREPVAILLGGVRIR